MIERTVPGCIRAVEEGLVERPAVRYNRIGIRVEAHPDRYVAGEASALVHWLNGGDAKPTFDLHHLAERGVEGCPTLVDNVGH